MNFKRRNPAADIIRIVALFLVISVHFCLNIGFYSQVVEGKRMFVLTVMRSFFIICVPLFLTLSGYLLRKKRLEVSYYGRIGKIVITYILASLACVFYVVVFQKQQMSITNVIEGILDFTAAPYSWYIEMYLGLFLLIPFLNIVYNALSTQKQKILLIITFIVLTALPPMLNVYNFQSLDWWMQPSSSVEVNKIFPAWWQSLYPITYYYIGCYLGEYGLKIKKSLNLALIIFWTLLSGSFCFWRSHQGKFIWGEWCAYQSLFNVVLTVLVFSFFININYGKLSNVLARFLQKVAGLCLGAYLVSWIFDVKVYSILSKQVPEVKHRLEYYIIVVPIIFALSLITSYLLSIIQFVVEKAFGVIKFKKESPGE